MIVQQVTTSLQQWINCLFAVSEPWGGEVEEGAPPDLRIDSSRVRKVLKGRRLPRSRRVFRGFDSPPGRF